jgi:hypothetical protein
MSRGCLVYGCHTLTLSHRILILARRLQELLQLEKQNSLTPAPSDGRGDCSLPPPVHSAAFALVPFGSDQTLSVEQSVRTKSLAASSVFVAMAGRVLKEPFTVGEQVPHDHDVDHQDHKDRRGVAVHQVEDFDGDEKG